MPTLHAKRANARVQPRDNGEFDIILSNGTKDRDGEVLAPDAWVMPLPEVIPLNVNHSSDVADVVGSGRPFIDAKGNLRVQGEFASTEQAQHIRTLVNEGHVKSVSVEFLRRKDVNGRIMHELVGGAFVNIPANPDARVLASKTTTTDWLNEMTLAVKTALADVLTKAPMPADPSQPTDPSQPVDPVAELVALVEQLQTAAPADVVPIATAIVAAAVQLGGVELDNDGMDGEMSEPDDEVTAKAAALRVRIKASR